MDFFIDTCDFYTIDVADFIGQSTDGAVMKAFVVKHEQYVGRLDLAGLETSAEISQTLLEQVAAKSR